MKKLYYASLFYAITGFLLGVFYRELTKFNAFEGPTQLSSTHTHAFALGMLVLLLVLLFEKNFKLSSLKSFNRWFILYNIGLIGILITMTLRGILQVKGGDIAGLNYVSGLTHTIYGVAVFWLFGLIKKKLV